MPQNAFDKVKLHSSNLWEQSEGYHMARKIYKWYYAVSYLF